MSTAWVVFRRELGAFFDAPIAYVVAIGFLLLNSSLYVLDLWASNEASLRGFFEWVSWSACFIIPAITMRSWADERRSATFELLLTLPSSTLFVVVGKFLAALAFYAFCLAGSLVLHGRTVRRLLPLVERLTYLSKLPRRLLSPPRSSLPPFPARRPTARKAARAATASRAKAISTTTTWRIRCRSPRSNPS